ncbi:MAG: helix-turn-helix transcriptional regulator [Lachnospiraceae bacterium]|nr:helix-turn-helix transcriptional regulator [Lachnospiraceae bacterium]
MKQAEVGLFIQSLRKEKNMTQRELADKLGVSDKAVSKWETGKSMPDTALFEPLCREFGISVNELLAAERCLPEDYVTKAEETLIGIYAENQKNKRLSKGQLFLAILGAVFAFIALFIMFGSVFGFADTTGFIALFWIYRQHLSWRSFFLRQYSYQEHAPLRIL